MPMPAEIAQQKMKKPMSPSILEEIGALNEFPKLQANFDPDKNWSHLYRIWLNHGFWGQLNLDAGVLRIERKTGKSDDQFTLKIVQKAVNSEGIINTVSAQIECSNDSISLNYQMRLPIHYIIAKIMPPCSTSVNKKKL